MLELMSLLSRFVQKHEKPIFDMTSSEKTRDASSTPKYSNTERNCKTTPPAPSHRLDIEDIYSDPDAKPNLEILKQHLLLEGRLTEQAALRIIETGKKQGIGRRVLSFVFLH